jgi:16S rRNA U1498 N3-methylase RsmE
LKVEIGDSIRCGIVDFGMTDNATIIESNDLNGILISLGDIDLLKKNKNDAPLIDLILAVPRPLRLERLIPIISCLGVNRLILIGAKKVEKDYFGIFFLFK